MLRFLPREERFEHTLDLPMLLNETVKRPEESGETRQEVSRYAGWSGQEKPLHLRWHALQMIAIAHPSQQVTDAVLLVRSVRHEDRKQLSVDSGAPSLCSEDDPGLQPRAVKRMRPGGEKQMVSIAVAT